MFLKIDNEKLNTLVSNQKLQSLAQSLTAYVRNLKYDYESHKILSVVQDQGAFDVCIHFDNHGEILSYTCSCTEGKGKAPCKHTLATLYKTQEKFLQKKTRTRNHHARYQQTTENQTMVLSGRGP
jgi:uncharacterized Zn finger protein